MVDTAFLRLLREMLSNENHRLGEKFGSKKDIQKHFKFTPAGEDEVLYDDLSGYYSIVKAIDDEIASREES